VVVPTARVTVAGAMRTTVTTAMATPNCDEKRGHQQQKQGQIDDDTNSNNRGGHHHTWDAAIVLTAASSRHAFVRSCCRFPVERSILYYAWASQSRFWTRSQKVGLVKIWTH